MRLSRRFPALLNLQTQATTSLHFQNGNVQALVQIPHHSIFRSQIRLTPLLPLSPLTPLSSIQDRLSGISNLNVCPLSLRLLILKLGQFTISTSLSMIMIMSSVQQTTQSHLQLQQLFQQMEISTFISPQKDCSQQAQT